MKAVPRPLVLVTENPAHRRVGKVERRSCGRQLGVLPPAREGLDTRRIGVVDQEGDVVAADVDVHMRERIRGQIVGYRQRRVALEIVKI